MRKYYLLFIIALFQIIVVAQVNDSLLQPALKLDLTVLDLPYQFDAAKTVNNGNLTVGSFFKGYTNPSMNQSLAITTDLYSSMHFGIDRIFKVRDKYRREKLIPLQKILNLGIVGGLDYFVGVAPGFGGWLHEEYHRGVMTRFHVNSFNDMNTFPIGQDAVSVNNIKDEDLIRFKSESPTDFIRMHVAGIEGEYQLVDKLQRENFFYKQELTHEFLYHLSTLNSVLYVLSSSDPEEVDTDTDEFNRKETEIAERDFTGYDFSAWAYDIFKPLQPYEERGVHPTGNGIDRYIKTTDLSSEELAYLRKQGYLQWLNYISPMMFGVRSIKINDDIRFNVAVRNYLTSFGNDVSLNAFLNIKDINFIARYHHSRNYKHTFPALEVELFEYPVSIQEHTFLLSPRVLTGVQPKGQSFYTNKADFLGALSCRVDWLFKTVSPWVDISGKTGGWIAGNEFLEKNVSFKLGVSARFK